VKGPNYDEIQTALEEAADGDDSALVELLHGAHGEEVRLQLSAWLHARGDFKVGLTRSSSIGAGALSTGSYDIVCTGYNGVSMNWVGKVAMACHGWLDYYISGGHSAHLCPDLWPTGPVTSAQCSRGNTGVFAAVVTLPTKVTLGSAVWGFGLITSINNIRVGCGARGTW
jgi:hypothetical protein